MLRSLVGSEMCIRDSIAESGDHGEFSCDSVNGIGNQCLYFDSTTNAAAAGAFISRTLNLEDATEATITYRFIANDDVHFEVFPHSNGTATWETKETHGSGNTATIVLNDADQLTANTQFRFRFDSTNNFDFGIDNFQVQWTEGIAGPPPPPAGYATTEGAAPPTLTGSSTCLLYTSPSPRDS